MSARTIDMEALHQSLKHHPRAAEIGMIASHRGLVRGTSRNGAPVKGLTVRFNREEADEIVRALKRRPGIIEVVLEYNEGDLEVGDDLMAVLVAGDIRENVFPVLVDAVNELKAKATKKSEWIAE